ncbi:TetR/AcrR family transcriptional regulator [Microbacterium elymi]|uniref:TetR/AcrR family transcriptional regulator n=1 Tax=Microbacterium elymi TaxID=2909587 RepID=A0ABY5NK82_9MICO|nr:TetR/AcrR family transcriptional regulator [Microbacterium elymi]UUT35544.1 TetR/AcrR family transcriptional regulator [Microbacterium elymi]
MNDDRKQEDLRARRADSTDRRVLRTRQKLVDAYRDLLDENAAAPVTVSAVVRRAGVTRSSFYAHFSGLSDLAAVALTEFSEAMTELARIAVREGGHKREVNERLLVSLAQFLADRREIYGELLSRRDEYAHAVTTALVEQSLATLRTRAHLHADPQVTARYIGGGLVAVLSWWLEAGQDRTAEELARALIAVTPPDFTL